MLKKRVPTQLWDYGYTWACDTDNVCANMSEHAKGRTPLEIITGKTPGISEYLDFDFYDWVLYRSNTGLGEVKVAKWLGVSHRVGRLMSYWLLPESGISISATTVQRMTNDEKSAEEMQKRMDQYEKIFCSTFDTKSAELTKSLHDVHPSLNIDPIDEDPSFYNNFIRVIDNTRLKHADKDSAKHVEVTSYPYVGLEMAIQRGADGETIRAKVRKCVRDHDGTPIGLAHSNPSLDSRQYEVKCVDGYCKCNCEEFYCGS